jgi:transcriptional regulator with GAF, ATPase, and Fis domain
VTFMLVSVTTRRGTNALDDLQREAIRQALADHNGNIARAAKQLGLKRQSLQRKMTRLGLRTPNRKADP